MTINQNDLLCEAADLLSEDGENVEYDRAIVELVTRLLPGFNHDDHDQVLALIQQHTWQTPDIDNSDEAVEARRTMFEGFGWGVTR